MTAQLDVGSRLESLPETGLSVIKDPVLVDGVPLARLTTLRVGGPARRVVAATTGDAAISAVREADSRCEPVLIVGGGSNLLVSDDGFAGTVLAIRSRGLTLRDASMCGGVDVTVAAGEPWDNFVAFAVSQGWAGVEALSGIPGRVGAVPVQNVGAYGQEVAETISAVRCYDRYERVIVTLFNADCGFSYRHSIFKERPGRYLILEVSFQLRIADLGMPVRYAELARTLGVEVGKRAPLADVREAVLGLRRGKGMVLDAADHDTWSAGSFFTNPVVPEDTSLPEGAPSFPAPVAADGSAQVKTSAAWLIDHAGFGKGHGSGGPASLSTKHVLALTNRGGASAGDLLTLARSVRDGVESAYGIRLVNEPVLVDCAL